MKIVIWTGGAFETWGPGSVINHGIGGSETAAARMADLLGQLGHDVQILGRVSGQRYGKSGGGTVDYLPVDPSRPPKITCDVFISSRQPDALRLLQPECRLRVLWMHDAWAEDWRGDMASYDVIFCLSKWARDLLVKDHPYVSQERFVLTRNGIEPDLYLRAGEDRLDPGAPVKVGTSCFYSSSPDRGLSKLLDLWPRIREVVRAAGATDATLDVFYGFNNWREAAKLEKNHGLVRLIDYLDHRVASMAGEGVRYRGRTGQIVLAKAQMASTFWLYPTSFCETSCITAMESQAAGAYPITSCLGALPETVMYGTLVGGEGAGSQTLGSQTLGSQTLSDDEYDEAFVDSVRNALDDLPCTQETMDHARRWALRDLGWDGVAEQWQKLFIERLGVA